MSTYGIILTQEPEGTSTVIVPELPGIIGNPSRSSFAPNKRWIGGF